MKRRKVLAIISACAAMTLLVPLQRLRPLFNRFKRPSWPDDETLDVLSIVAEYIYPRDEAPGALDLGIRTFFTMQLNTNYYRQNATVIERFVNFIDDQAAGKNGRKFIQLGSSEQSQILSDISSGHTDRYSPQVREDFNYIIQCTIEGCFSSPRHGGNSGKKGWKIFGNSFKEEWMRV